MFAACNEDNHFCHRLFGNHPAMSYLPPELFLKAALLPALPGDQNLQGVLLGSAFPEQRGSEGFSLLFSCHLFFPTPYWFHGFCLLLFDFPG